MRTFFVGTLFSATTVFANPAVPLLPNAVPAGGTVVAGSATITQSQNATSATMNVNQTSQRAVINWDSFNVGKNATVNFNQPNANAVTLNRVTSATPSMIDGAVKANGQVVFVNPNGVTFGKGADINAAGVVATTMDMANKDFMDGKSTYKGNGSGAVINEGKIKTNAEHGYIALLAPEVRNDGYLLAKKGSGTVALASGEQITLDFKGDALISVKVDTATYKGLIENKRVVEVDGGLVVLATGAANQLMGSVIKNTGKISANSLVNNGGVIELVANTVTQAGKVSANSQSKEGGQINIVGNDITIAQNSKTTATGAQGGGQINIGLASTQVTGGTQVNALAPSAQTNVQAEAAIKANAQAAGNTKQMAKTVTVERGALIDTSATQSGNGGSIAIWSQVKTTVAGILTSMGGALSGNGGFIETSSKTQVSLAPTAQINTSASKGKSGTWLLDPIDLTIDVAAANIISAALSYNNVIIEVNANTTACPSVGGCTQNGSGSLTIASGADILKSGTNLTTLTLSASGIFNLNADIRGENLDVIIRSSIAYLNIGTTISATKVTVQAQTIYTAGTIQTNRYLSNTNPDSLGNAMELLAQAIYVSGRLSASTPSNRGAAGSIKLTANTITLQAGAILKANGDEGGVITIAANDDLWSSASIQANGGNGRGGTLLMTAANDLHFNQALLQANGTTDGGAITLIANQGDLIIQNALIQTNGSTGRGGSIGASASNEVSTDSSTFEATGYTHGGQILIGNDAQHGTLPFALVANLDQYTSFNTAQLDLNPANQQGGFIETSGQTLNMLSSINAGRGGMWLIDPYDITIGATEAGYINTALNASTNVTITTASVTNSVGSNTISGVSGTGIIYIKSAINATTGSASLTLTASEIQLEANITTRGSQTYNGNLLLAQNSILTSNNGDVTVNGDIRSTGYLLSGYLSLTGAGGYNLMGTTGTVTATPTLVGGGYLSYSSANTTYTWVPGNSFASQYLLVGAGGSGGGNNGGGGGAGAVTSDLAYAVIGGESYLIKVGVGVSGSAGGLSSITVDGVTTTATGGAVGGGGGSYGAGRGGSSGYTIINGVSSTAYTGGPSRSGTCCTQQSGGGGGGAAGSTSNITGGIGIASSITGTSVTYGVGGNGVQGSGSNGIQGATAAGAGSGGGGGGGGYGLGPAGRNGVVIFQGEGFSPDIYSITINSGSGVFVVTGDVTNTSGITVSSSNSLNRIDGAISGIASITKEGSGVLLLNGINTYSGGTTISAGTLKAGSNQAFGALASSMTVTSGATLDLNGTNQSILNSLTARGVGVSSNGAIINSNTGIAATYRGAITLSAMTQIGGAGDLTLTGAITSSTGIVFVNSSYVTATNLSNNVNTVSGSAVRGLTLVNSAALSVGTVNSVSGFTSATGPISITVNSGGLAVSQIISTTGNLTLVGNASSTTTALGITTAITGDEVSLTGNSATGYAVSVSGGITSRAGITVNGTATTAANIVSLSAMTLSVGGSGNISVTANNTAGGANAGITQTGAISNNVSGSNISFISNNIINQTGAISIVANTSGTSSNVLYDTSSGTKASNIIAGALTIASGSTSDVSYIAKSAGAGINPGALVIPGSVLLDNTYGGTAGVGGTPTSGYITNANSGSLTSAIIGINANASITAGTGITLKGASQTGYYSVAVRAALISTVGNIEISGSGINYSVYSNSAGVILAKAGAVNITGTSTTGQAVELGAAITANAGITINGTATTASTITTVGALTLGYGYFPGGNSNPSVISSATGTSGSLIGALSGGTLPTIASAALVGASIGGDGIYAATAAALQSSTSTTATYVIGYANGVHTKMVQLVLTSSGGFVFATETLAKYNTTQLASGTAANVLGGTTNLLQLWSGSGVAGGLGTATSATLATSAAAGGYAAANLTLTGAGFSSNVSTGDITITANNTAAGGNTGISQAGNITNNANGSNITFTSNNIINQTGAISLAANTSGNVSTVTYDTTSGTKTSTITGGSLTITSGSTSNINYVAKSAGANIDPGVINVPGTITLDNTFGCSGSNCTPASGFITAANIASGPSGVAGITINNAITATGDITVKGVSNGNYSIYATTATTSSTGAITWTGVATNYGIYTGSSATITATAGDVTITGTSTTGQAVNLSALVTGDSIAITGTGTTATTIMTLATLTVNAGGSDITITANNTAAGGNTGISQAGNITNNASGSNITFTSNNIISQTGAISLAANTSGDASTVTYDTTSGTKTSTITGGSLTITSGSTSDINYVMKSLGSNINPGAIGTSSARLPGTVTLDNTYGSSSPTSGHITTSNNSTLATSSVGVTINNAIYSTKLISIKGVSYTSHGISYSAVINSSAGGLELAGATYNSYGIYTASSLITANYITINARATVAATYVSYLGPMTINSGSTGGDITVSAIGTTAGNDTGIYQGGAISAASGSDITFTSNNIINQTGAISLAANTSGDASTVTYDTTSGTKVSNITSGALTIGANSTSDINYVMKSLGSNINPGAIGTSSARLPGTVTIDNTYGGVTPSSGYITTSNNSTLATSSYGSTINNAIYSTKLISIKGISYASHGISYSAAINSSAGGVELTGATYNSYGLYTASALITANYITINARATIASTYVSYLGPMTINSGSTGGDITITATGTTAGNDTGIYQSGAISAANGSDITFTSNNIINQTGLITMAANTTAISNVIYDTTSGNRLSNISSVAISTTSGSTFAINYTAKSAGSAISVDAISVPGYINLDNTYGSASGAKSSGYLTALNISTSNATGSAGVLVGGALTAGNALTIRGVSASSWAIQNSSGYTLTAGAGDLSLIAVGVHGIYQMGSLIASSGNIFASAYSTSSSWSYYAQVGSQKNYIASGNIDLISYATTYSNAFNIRDILMRTTTGDITLSARGGNTGNGAVHQANYLAGVVINAGGDFVIQGATNTGGVATAAPGTASSNTLAHYGVHFASSASLAYGGITYTGYKAAGNINIAGTSASSYGVYIAAAIESTAGSVIITGTSTTGDGVISTSAGTIKGFSGVSIYGRGNAGSITTGALVSNVGSAGGIIINAVANASVGAVTNSGSDGIRITGGNGIAAGTTTGGTITALGTVTNSGGGVVALSMASPRAANSYDIEGKVGITTSNASDANIRYSVQGGNFTTPTGYSSGNYIDYRSGPTSYTVTVALGANYSAAYGTAYTDSSALTWLRNNATVTLSATPFGVSTAGIKAGLVWNSTIGSSAINANVVQAGTTIIAANISTGTGQGVALSGTSRTYTITTKALTIANNSSTTTYNGTSSYAGLVSSAGYTVTGLVTSIGGVAVTDAVSSVTQTLKSGASVGSGSSVSGTAQNGSFNAVPSSATGTGLSNYSITYTGAAYTVNKATLTIAAAADTKAYGNTTTNAGIAYSAGSASASAGVGYSITAGSLLGSDTLTGVTLSSLGGAATASVGTGITITPSSASGSGIGNYTITYANGAMAITQRALTVTASNQNTSYGTSYGLGTSSFTTSGLVNSDAVSSVTLKYGSSSTVPGSTSAGTYAGGIVPSAASGTGLSNYAISYVAGNLAIATKSLTITADTQNSTYGSSLALGTSAFTTNGLVNSDAVNSVTLRYNGNNSVAPTLAAATYSGGIVPSAADGTGLSNYNISYVAGNLVIAKATLTLTPNAVQTSYTGNALNKTSYSTSTANYTIAGYKNTDVAADAPISLSGLMAFNGSTSTTVQNAASYALTTGTLAGTTSNTNYQVSFDNAASHAYVIAPAIVSVSAVKDYDGSRTFAANQISIATGIGSQTLTLTGNATSDSANVVGVSSLSTSGLSLGNGSNGGLASNYVLPTTTTSVLINPVALTVAIANTPTKVYDTSAAVTLTSSNFALSNFVAGEGATITQTVGAFNSGNATTNTSYTPATTVTAALTPLHFTADVGTTLSNYTLPTSATGSGTITAAPLTISANSYAGFAGQTPSFAGTVNGAKGSDNITVSIASTPSGTPGIDTLTPTAVMASNLLANYASPTVVTGTYTVAQQYQLVVTASNSSNNYGDIAGGSAANSVVNLLAQYCTVSSNCTSGTIITLAMSAPTATVSQITSSSSSTPTWVATDAAANSYSLQVTADSALSFSGGNFLNVGSKVFTPTGASNATIEGATNPVIYVTGTVSVAPLAVTVTDNSAPNKVYDATTALTSGLSLTPSNKLTGDRLILTGGGVYSSKNVGTTNYTINSVALSGLDAANYVYIAGNIAGTNGTITAAPITISGLSASNKTYDTNQVATLSGAATAAGVLSGDTVTVSGTANTGTFASPNVASGIAVTADLSGLTLSNNNYSINGVTTALSADIEAAPVTVTINKDYNGSTAVVNNQMTLTGVAGQTLVLTTGTATLTNPNVGSAGLLALNGASLGDGTGLASNYTLTNPNSVVTINRALISVGASNAVKVYDTGTDVASATTAPAPILVSGTLFTNSATGYTDTLSGGTYSYTNANAGSSNKTLNVSGVSILNDSSSAANNYTVTYVANTTSTITAAPITISGLSASNKTYDTNQVATLSGAATAAGVLSGDTVTVSGTANTGTFASPNVASGIAVTADLSGLTLSNNNYSINGVTTALSADIEAAPVTVTINKDYNGSTAVVNNQMTLTGVAGQTLVLTTGTATLTNPNVGSAGLLALNGASLGDGTGLASNYTLTNPNSVVTINRALISVGASNAVKVYDTGTDVASATTAPAPILVSGTLFTNSATGYTDTLSGGTYSYTNANAGSSNKTLNVSGVSILNDSSSAANNYTVTYVANTTSTITAAPITISGLSASNKTYDTNQVATLSGAATAAGVLSGDTVTVSGTANTGTFASPNVASGIAVTADLSGLTLSNNNYSINGVTTALSADITAAPITIGGLSASNKTYDTNRDAIVSGTPELTGVLGSDSVIVIGSVSSGLFASKNVASGIAVTADLSGLTLSNNNYSINGVTTALSADITAAPITISGLSASNKTYDTNQVATLSGAATAAGVLSGDTVTVSGTANTGTFASPNVASGIAVTADLSGLTLSNNNYSINGVTTALSADITAAPITISGLSASNKTYDTNQVATLSGAATAAGVLSGDTVTVSGTANTGTFASPNVASGIAVTADLSGLTLSNNNYSINGVTTALSADIEAAPVTVSVSNQNTTYGTNYGLGTSGFTTSGLLGSDAINSVTLRQGGNTTVPGTQNAGVYSGASNGILASAAVGSGLSNYAITYVPGTLTIAPKPISVIANNASMTYADPSLPTFSYQAVSGLVNGDQITGALVTTATPYTGTAGSASNVGSYGISQGTVTAGSNYQITFTAGDLTVNPANLTIAARNQTTSYGSLLVLLQSGSAALTTTGLLNGDYVSSASVLYAGSQTVSGAVNAGSYPGTLIASGANGLGMGNYNIAYQAGNLIVDKAVLTVTAVDSAKFIGMSDPAGYSGVMYSGFKNGDTSSSGALGSTTASVNRTNSSQNNAGTYNNVLVPTLSGDLQNYTVSYVPGSFVIVGANQLLVQLGSNSAIYGATPNYSASGMTVSYCTNCAIGVLSPSIIALSNASLTIAGTSMTVVDGNTNATFTISPENPVLNSSGARVTVGSYALGASGTSISTTPAGGTPNFNAVVVSGGLTVNPIQLTYVDLGISGVSKVYDGSVNMTNLSLSTTSGFLTGDVVTASASGTFASKNVGSAIAYNVGVALSGADAGNYLITGGSSYAGNNGVITQLNSVTYTGPNSGGKWSNPLNWTTTGTSSVGAIPDLSNVANVVLPSGKSVIYDDSVQGPVTSTVANSGNLSFNLSTDTTVPMAISGSGTVTISGAGIVTLTGNSSYTGATILNAGTSLIAGANNAIGSGFITSNGSVANPASFSTSSGVILPSLNIAGGSTEIWSDIATAGTQTYSGSLLIGPSSGGSTSLTSSNANISINGTLDGASNKTESLVINSGSGVVTIGDSVGSIARLNNLTITGSRIYILADILTGVTQTYNGAVYIGDASYLGRTPTVGFLFTDNYRGYFQYVADTGVRASTISYLDLNPIYVRTMISEDPSITYNGTVNDTVANTHTLLVAAIAPAVIPSSSGYAAINNGASISFNAAVGAIDPLYSLNAQTVVSNTQVNAATTYIGTVSLSNSVATYSDQTYRANLMSAQSSTQPGGVTFSVWDPVSSLNFNLPLQEVANSGCSTNCGQLNLQNPNSLDSLTLNGVSNFIFAANLTGVNNWGSSYVQNEALGYIPPAVIPPPPAVRPSFIPVMNGGMLREVLDFHADQVQMTVDAKILAAGVTVSSPEEIAQVMRSVIASTKTKGTKATLNSAGAAVICSVDEKGDAYCGEE